MRASWTGAQAAPAKAEKKPVAPKEEAPKEAPKEVKNEEDELDMDLFGDDEPTAVINI